MKMELERLLFGVRCVILGSFFNAIFTIISFYLLGLELAKQVVVVPFVIFLVAFAAYLLYFLSILLQEVRSFDERVELEKEIEEESREELTMVESESTDERL